MKGNVDLLLLGCVLGYFFLFRLHNCVYRPALFSLWARRSTYGVGWACENVQNQPIPHYVIVSPQSLGIECLELILTMSPSPHCPSSPPPPPLSLLCVSRPSLKSASFRQPSSARSDTSRASRNSRPRWSAAASAWPTTLQTWPHHWTLRSGSLRWVSHSVTYFSVWHKVQTVR